MNLQHEALSSTLLLLNKPGYQKRNNDDFNKEADHACYRKLQLETVSLFRQTTIPVTGRLDRNDIHTQIGIQNESMILRIELKLSVIDNGGEDDGKSGTPDDSEYFSTVCTFVFL